MAKADSVMDWMCFVTQTDQSVALNNTFQYNMPQSPSPKIPVIESSLYCFITEFSHKGYLAMQYQRL